MYKSDPQSNRSKRRANREKPFDGSRPNRRANKRLEARLTDYEKNATDNGFTKPGARKPW